MCNLAVVDDETYLADGLIVHNCRSQAIEIWKDEEIAEPTDIPSGLELPQEGFQTNVGVEFLRAA